MSHNASHVIIDAIVPILSNTEVRDSWTAEQCTRVDAIRACAPNWSDEQTRYVLRRLAQAACQGD